MSASLAGCRCRWRTCPVCSELLKQVREDWKHLWWDGHQTAATNHELCVCVCVCPSACRWCCLHTHVCVSVHHCMWTATCWSNNHTAFFYSNIILYPSVTNIALNYTVHWAVKPVTRYPKSTQHSQSQRFYFMMLKSVTSHLIQLYKCHQHAPIVFNCVAWHWQSKKQFSFFLLLPN